MSAYFIKKLAFDFEYFKKKISRHIEHDVSWLPATSRTPNAVWCDISTFLDKELRSQIEATVGWPLHDIFWLCDYRKCRELEVHRDNPGNEYPIRSMFTIIMMIEGRFEMCIWQDDQKTLIEKFIICPGEIAILNFSQYYHSGRVLDDKKISLHAYPSIPEIDQQDVFGVKFNVEDYIL